MQTAESIGILRFNTKVHFGHGSRSELAAEMQEPGMKRPLFVTDKGVVGAGVFAMAIDALGLIAHAAVFDATPPNPTEAALDQRLGLPRGLCGFGIEESVFPAIAAASLLDNAHKTTPRVLAREDYIALLNAAR